MLDNFYHCSLVLYRLLVPKIINIMFASDYIFLIPLCALILGQIMEKRGSHLSEIDLSGMRKSDFTDEGLRAISKYCMSLEELNISMCHTFTGNTLQPLLEDAERAPHLRKLYLSSRQVGQQEMCSQKAYRSFLWSRSLSLLIVQTLLFF